MKKKFCNKYRRPGPDLPEDSGAAEIVNDAGLEVWGLDGVVAPVRHGVGVDPVVPVDAMARDAPVTHPLAARVRTLCARNKFEIVAFGNLLVATFYSFFNVIATYISSSIRGREDSNLQFFGCESSVLTTTNRNVYLSFQNITFI